MKKLLLPFSRQRSTIFVGLLLTTIIVSCAPTRHVVVPERHTEYIRDTILRADSVYVSHYETYHPSPSGEGPGVRLVTDTVLKYLYRDKVVEVIQHDSIPYPVEVIVPGDSPVPRFFVNCTIGFWLIIIGFILYIAARLYLHR